MGKTVGQLLHDLDEYGGGVDELIEWMAFQRLEPFGYSMRNFRMGVIASTVVNCTPRGKGAKPMKPSDFYPAARASSGLTTKQQKHLEAKARKKRGN